MWARKRRGHDWNSEHMVGMGTVTREAAEDTDARSGGQGAWEGRGVGA